MNEGLVLIVLLEGVVGDWNNHSRSWTPEEVKEDYDRWANRFRQMSPDDPIVVNNIG